MESSGPLVAAAAGAAGFELQMLALPAALAPLTAVPRPGRRRSLLRHVSAVFDQRCQTGGERAQITIINAPPAVMTARTKPASVWAARMAIIRSRNMCTSHAVPVCVCVRAEVAHCCQSCTSVCRRTGLRVGI